MTEMLELTRRADALETAQNDTTQTLRWVVAKLGRMSAVQEEHTLRLERLESDMTSVRQELKGLRQEFNELRLDLPTIIAETMREVLKEQR
jgi:hypothetical protein